MCYSIPDVLLQARNFVPLPVLPSWNTARAIPRCIVLEGGTEEERYLAAVQLLNSYKCSQYGVVARSTPLQNIDEQRMHLQLRILPQQGGSRRQARSGNARRNMRADNKFLQAKLY